LKRGGLHHGITVTVRVRTDRREAGRCGGAGRRRSYFCDQKWFRRLAACAMHARLDADAARTSTLHKHSTLMRRAPSPHDESIASLPARPPPRPPASPTRHRALNPKPSPPARLPDTCRHDIGRVGQISGSPLCHPATQLPPEAKHARKHAAFAACPLHRSSSRRCAAESHASKPVLFSKTDCE